MLWILLALQFCTVAALAFLWWSQRRRDAGAADDGAEADALIALSVERLLTDVEQSTDRAAAALQAQIATLEGLVRRAGLELPAPAATPPPGGWSQEAASLAAGGLTPRGIARRLGRGEAEIRLALESRQAAAR